MNARLSAQGSATSGSTSRIVLVCCGLLSGTLCWSGCVQLLDIPDDPQLAPDATQGQAQAAGGSSSSGESNGSAGTNRDGAEQRDNEVAMAGEGSEEDARPDELMPNDPTTTETGASGTSSGESEQGESSVAEDAGASADDALGEAPEDAAPDAGNALTDAAPLVPSEECGGSASLGPNQRCYLVLETPVSWDQARLACIDQGEGWDLATIRSAAVNTFAASLTGDEFWLGGSDATSEGNWVWASDGLPFWLGDATGGPVDGAFANWNSDEPNGGGNSDCARMVPGLGGIWADLECDFDRLPLCEGPPL